MNCESDLEGNAGSGFDGEDEDFPDEWNVIDDLGDDCEDSSDIHDTNKNNVSNITKETVKSKKENISRHRKKDEGESSKNKERNQHKSKDRKSQDSYHRHYGRSRSRDHFKLHDRKSNSRSQDRFISKSHDRKSSSRTRNEINTKIQNRKSDSSLRDQDRSKSHQKRLGNESKDKHKSKSHDRKLDRSSNMKHPSEETCETETSNKEKGPSTSFSHLESKSSDVVYSSSKVESDLKRNVQIKSSSIPNENKLDSKEKNAHLKQSGFSEEKEKKAEIFEEIHKLNTANDEHPTPAMSAGTNEDACMFSDLKQAARYQLVTGGSDSTPNFIPFPKESKCKNMKWSVRVYPLYGCDLALVEMRKIVNMCGSFGIFFLPGASPKSGDLSLMIYHKNQVKHSLIKIFNMELQATEISIFISKRNHDDTLETGEIKLNLRLSHNMKMKNLPHEAGSVGIGNPENRSIFVKNVPKGTSTEIMEVLFPISSKITLSQESKKEMMGSATIEFQFPELASTTMACYKEVKIAENKLILQFDGNIQKVTETEQNKNNMEKKYAENVTSEQLKSRIDKSIIKPKTVLKSSTDKINPQKSRDGGRPSVNSQQDHVKRLRDRSRQILIKRDVSERQRQLQQMEHRTIQQEAVLSSNIMRHEDVPVTFGTVSDPVDMKEELPPLPEGLTLGEKQHRMVLEIQRQRQKKMEQNKDSAWKHFQQHSRSPNSTISPGSTFTAQVEKGMCDTVQQQQLVNRDKWLQEQKTSYDQRTKKKDRTFVNRGSRNRNSMNRRRLYQNFEQQQQQKPQYGILPGHVQGAGTPYLMQGEKKQNEIQNRNITSNINEIESYNREAVRDRDGFTTRQSIKQTMDTRNDVTDRSRQALSGNMRDRNMLEEIRLAKERMDLEMAEQNFIMHNISSQDVSSQNSLKIHGQAVTSLPDSDTRDTISERFQLRQQQMHGFKEIAYGIDEGPGLFGNVTEYGHGSTALKRPSQSEQDSIPAKRSMSDYNSSAFSGRYGHNKRQAGMQQPAREPIMQVSEQESYGRQYKVNKKQSLETSNEPKNQTRQHIVMQQQMLMATGRFLQTPNKR